MTDRISKEHRSWNMSRIRGKDTKPELMLRRLLHRTGFRFRLHTTSMPGKPDIVLSKYRTVIFVHGCFWHRHEGCSNATTPKTRPEFWQEKFDRTVERDREKRAQLEDAGWKVLIVWECELKNEPSKLEKKLLIRYLKIILSHRTAHNLVIFHKCTKAILTHVQIIYTLCAWMRGVSYARQTQEVH